MKAIRLPLVIVLLLPIRALHAEEERALMSVNIPFAFTVENTQLPAGIMCSTQCTSITSGD